MGNRLLVGVAIILLSTSCSGLKRMQKHGGMDINPMPLELSESGNRVDIDYSLSTPRKFLKKKEQLVFSPEITDGTNVMDLTDVIINGKRFERKELRAIKKGKFKADPNSIKIIATKEPMRITVDDNVPFMLWMVNSQMIGHTFYDNGYKSRHIFEQVMAEGVYYKPEIVVVEPPVVVEEAELLNKSDKAAIFFKINSAEIKDHLENNDLNLKTISSLLKQINDNKDAELKSVTVIGIASPDGIYESNEQLSKERAQEAKKYLIENCNVKANMIKTENIAEDWDGLVKLLNNASISDRNTLISMIRSNKTDAEKNMILKSSINFNTIAKDLLPKLRRTIYNVNFTQLSTGELIVVPIEIIEL
ncbi:MAG: OmpA family protein [Rikenellaceae bacterium]